MGTQELTDIQALINIFFPFAEELLIKYGEFLPYAGATTTAGDFVSVGRHDENEDLDTNKAISNLKHALHMANSQYLVVAVFYEAVTKDSETGKTSDAIAVYIEHKDGETGYEFFYPYRVEDKENFIVEDSFGNAVTKQVFSLGIL